MNWVTITVVVTMAYVVAVAEVMAACGSGISHRGIFCLTWVTTMSAVEV